MNLKIIQNLNNNFGKKDKEKFKKIISIFIIVLTIILISCIFYFGKEIKEAKSFCESQNGSYSWKLLHYCNGRMITKYKNRLTKEVFWNYESYNLNNLITSMNYSEIMNDLDRNYSLTIIHVTNSS